MEPLITKEESRHKINIITSRIHNNLNCYYGNVLQSNTDSTKKKKFILLNDLLSKQCKKVSVAVCFAPMTVL